jgi:SAM-dependent methyltransferase
VVDAHPDALATDQRGGGPSCRSCRAPLQHRLLDLGEQPLGDVLLDKAELTLATPAYPLGLTVCTACWLLQLSPFDAAPDVPDSHGHNSSYSTTTTGHERGWAEELTSQLGIRRHRTVIEVGSGDGSLLRHFADRGARVLGVEARASSVAAARASGVPTLHATFGVEAARRLAAEGWAADLVVANHTLPHVDDLDGFLAGVRMLLAPGGRFSTEFVHALAMVEQGQFDLVCHSHRSYLSLTALGPALSRQELSVAQARQVPVHGGSVRVLAAADPVPGAGDGTAAALLRAERAAGLTQVQTYRRLGERARQARSALLRLLDDAKRRGQSVVAYGAPTRGSTLLNYCAVTPELVGFTVDRSPAKQGRYLPGSHLPVRSPDQLDQARPDYVLILPWTLGEEIMRQLEAVRSWGGRFVLPLPTLTVVP